MSGTNGVPTSPFSGELCEWVIREPSTTLVPTVSKMGSLLEKVNNQFHFDGLLSSDAMEFHS